MIVIIVLGDFTSFHVDLFKIARHGSSFSSLWIYNGRQDLSIDEFIDHIQVITIVRKRKDLFEVRSVKVFADGPGDCENRWCPNDYHSLCISGVEISCKRKKTERRCVRV